MAKKPKGNKGKASEKTGAGAAASSDGKPKGVGEEELGTVPRAVGLPSEAWQSVAVEGGEIRVHPVYLRIDGHCRPACKCKIDRSGGKGPLGLILLWLSTPCRGKPDHDRLKTLLGKKEYYHDRHRLREDWLKLADEKGGVYALALQVEMAARGTSEEPERIPG